MRFFSSILEVFVGKYIFDADDLNSVLSIFTGRVV